MSTFRRPSNKPSQPPSKPPVEQEWQPEEPQPGSLFGHPMPPSPAERWRVGIRNTRLNPLAPGRNYDEAKSDLLTSLAWSSILFALSLRAATELMAEIDTAPHILAAFFYILASACVIFPVRRTIFLLRSRKRHLAIKKANHEHSQTVPD